MSKMKFDIYTGYYAQMKKYRQMGLIPVSIAYLTPQWLNDPPKMVHRSTQSVKYTN